MTELILWKVFYFSVILVLPMLLTATPWWHTLLFFVMMQLVAGLILACIFQPAHVMPSSDYPVPSESGYVENSWAVHQMYTSCNFATGSRWFSWFVGGLNFQIEHHLFPNICHVHYKEVARIVEDAAREFNLPYISHPTFFRALREHGKMLKILGAAPN
jgi:linoleoyl-CoA desaturase